MLEITTNLTVQDMTKFTTYARSKTSMYDITYYRAYWLMLIALIASFIFLILQTFFVLKDRPYNQLDYFFFFSILLLVIALVIINKRTPIYHRKLYTHILTPVTHRFDTDGIHSTVPEYGTTAYYPYTSLFLAEEKEDTLYIFVTNCSAIIIPKSAFTDDVQHNTLKEILELNQVQYKSSSD